MDGEAMVRPFSEPKPPTTTQPYASVSRTVTVLPGWTVSSLALNSVARYTIHRSVQSSPDALDARVSTGSMKLLPTNSGSVFRSQSSSSTM